MQRLSSLVTSSSKLPRNLHILDLCTGTGCISLLIHSLLVPQIPKLQVLGLDNSPRAIALARRNLKHNLTSGHLSVRAKSEVSFVEGNIFAFDDNPHFDEIWDILISNPPYISPENFRWRTARSVRNHEPKTALVPSSFSLTSDDITIGDTFYPRLLAIAGKVQAKLLLMEVADLAQARRVAGMVLKDERWLMCEIWRDWPTQADSKAEVIVLHGRAVRVRGEGHARAVFAWTASGGKLIGFG